MLIKKMKILFAFAICFVFISQASAASTCSYERQNELNAIANNIRTNVSVEDRVDLLPGVPEGSDNVEMLEIEYTTFDVQILNLNENVYFTVRENGTRITDTYYPVDFKDNKFVFETRDPSVSITYTVTVMSNDSNCMGDTLRIIEVTTPVLNPYALFGICDGSEEFYLCRRVLGSNVGLNENDILNAIANYKEGLVDEEGNEIPEKTINNDTFIKIVIGVSIIVAIGISVIVIRWLKRRKSVI